MDLTARPYRCFLAIVDHRTFSAAAATLHMSQPALSAQIRELERQLGFALFTRSSRKVALTPAGRMFVDNARRIVLETDWINQAARDIRTNPLRIGTPHFSGRIEERSGLFDRFIIANSNVPLSITTRTPAQLISDFREHALDLALTLNPRSDGEVSHRGDEDIAHLTQMILGTRHVRLIIPSEHPLASQETIRKEQLAGESVCTPSRAHGIFLSELIARQLSRLGANRTRTPEGDAISVLRYAAATRTLAIDLGWFAPAANSPYGPLVSRPVEALDIAIDLVLLRDDRAMRPSASRFWSLAEQSKHCPRAHP